MTQGTIVLDINSFWHAGTGRGDGPGADAIIARSREGLPYLPGRTVKGLVRDAMRLAALADMASADDIETWFGSDLLRGSGSDRERQLEEARFRTRPGTLRFESATLGASWAVWAAANPVDRRHLVRTFASTRIEFDGTAKDETLRVIEIAVPLTLRATVLGLDPAAAKTIGDALPVFLRNLGSHRRRGLGRVAARLEVA